MSQAGRLGTVAALLLVGLIITGCLLLLPTDRLRLGGRLNSAATGTALHSVSLCPRLECPNCTALRIAADERTRQQKKTKPQQGEQQQHEEEEQEETEGEQEQQQKQQQQQQQAAVAGNASAGGDVPLLCGGLPSVPSVQDALAEAWARLEASLDAAFAAFAGGFTLEDLMHTATALGVDGTHDTQVWVEVSVQGQLCRAVLCHAVPWCAMLWCAMPGHAVLCCAVLFHLPTKHVSQAPTTDTARRHQWFRAAQRAGPTLRSPACVPVLPRSATRQWCSLGGTSKSASGFATVSWQVAVSTVAAVLCALCTVPALCWFCCA